MLVNESFYYLRDRIIIQIHGKDKFSFIQGIISNDVNILKKKTSIYSSILTPQGRFITDFFLSMYKDSFLIEIHKNDKEVFLQKLNIYKLRSEVEFTILKNCNVFLIFSNSQNLFSNISYDQILFFDDPRFKSYLKRLYFFDKKNYEILKKNNIKEISSNEYDEIRFRNGIPDFQVDATKNKSLLMEMRFEDLNGISWDKGCYMGQEITARMKYRNLMKRKIFNIKINFVTHLESSIKVDDQKIGELTSHNKKYGFGYINLNYFKKKNKNSILCGDSFLSILKPWWSKT